jgi:MerR family mercuric resistance operon transcriptional regulator/MerR family gold-responsive transcriptional activator of gol and ges genes
MTSAMTIGKLAKAGGVNIQTIRYYERRNVLRPKAKRPSGYLLYDDEALRQLHFIKNAQLLGFTLHEIGELLHLRVNAINQCRNVQRKAQAKLVQVKAKLKEIRALARGLQTLIQTCKVGKPTDRCPIVKCFENPPKSWRLRKAGQNA